MRIALYLINLDEEYQLSIYRGIHEVAERLGIDLICVQRDFTNLAPSIPADGILLLSSVLFTKKDTPTRQEIEKRFGSVPCVSIGDRLPGIPSIIIHNRDSMKKLVDHLITRHGYRKLLFIGGPAGHRDNTVREHVFSKAIEERRAFDPGIEGSIATGGFREAAAVDVVQDIIGKRGNDAFDAIVAANDDMAIGALKVLRTSPSPEWRKCAVTGFDDIPQAKYELPPLTTVHQPLDELGNIAMSTIEALVRGETVKDVSRIDSYAVFRQSCGCEANSGTAADAERPRVGAVGLPANKDPRESAEYRSFLFVQNVRNVSSFGQQLTTAESLDDLLGFLKTFLDACDVRVFFLLLYPQGRAQGSDAVDLVYRRFRNRETSLVSNPERTSIARFFSEDFRSEPGEPAAPCIYNLRSGADDLGFIVYESSYAAHQHLCSAAVFIANTVKRLQTLEDEKDRALRLEDEVALRTGDLVRINRELRREAERRHAVEAEVLRISELERLRFSLDLHDDICQRLAGISMYAKSLGSGADLGELSQMIDETLLRTRQYAHDSFPVELDSLGLNDAIGSLCIAIERQTGCECEWETDVPDGKILSDSQEINLYRIVQEAMNNVVKHSKATKASVTMSMKKNTLTVRVWDNGMGIGERVSAAKNVGEGKKRPHIGIGLKSMEYRAHQIGAKYALRSSDKGGTTVEIRIPVGTEEKRANL
jgi:signal transduction histidine kinase/DNA-binding LacI/PurR family transcriptional regulator